MSTDFHTRIRRSIDDENLQMALDNNARRRREARLATFASLPDQEERRQRAHTIKAEVIAHLDEHLGRFSEKAAANGILVHRAADANEAVEIFLEIARQAKTGPGKVLVAKSKSMISEEIELNHALERAGMQAVETDLGEYIVQLRGEPPSHIITPAVHLRRGDVGQLFAEKLGLPYTEDIPILTNTARKTLRDVFLKADIGVSGVNFGVAESGTLCIVTNEGNGRMVTTLPRVHVALMGIERLVPTMDDLALFLSLLPRSATGQKLSVYTNLVNAPLGGQTRHLILLDNGRSALRDSPLAESLYCIRCGACLNACPVFRELGGHAYGSIYPGPIGSVISSSLVNPSFNYLAQASSLCGACREACPVDIDLPTLLLRVRAGQAPDWQGKKRQQGAGLPGSVKVGLGAFRLAASNAGLFSFFQVMGGLASRLFSPRRAYMRLPVWTGWGYSKDFPRLAVRPFRARWKGLKQVVHEDKVGNAHHAPASTEASIPQGDLAAQFSEELSALGGEVDRVKAQDLPTKLGGFLAARGIERVCADEVGAEAVRRKEMIAPPEPSVRCGVTGAVCGIADTGSLLLAGAEKDALTPSLLPEVHIVLLKRSQLVPTLAEALARPEARQAGAVVVSGPSRTADIEMTLTIGVHGPGELHVLLIDDL